MLVSFVYLPEDHTRNMAEFVLQGDIDYFALRPLPADDQSGGRHPGAVGRLLDIFTVAGPTVDISKNVEYIILSLK